MEKKLKAAAAAKEKAELESKRKKEEQLNENSQKSYRMSDPHSSDDSSESESDSDDDGKPKKKKKPPAPWARKSPLKKALKIQFGVIGTEPPLNPDEIFADITTCDLEKVFDMKKKRYQRRGSSGYWQTDRVTDDEKRAYARRMGFAPALLHKTL